MATALTKPMGVTMPVGVTIAATEFDDDDMALLRIGNKPDYTMNDPLSTPAGFTNYSAAEMRAVVQWKQDLATVFRTYGYTPIDPPPVEFAANLQKTGGLDKQIFGVSRLQDGSLTKLGLPFDHTVPMAIFIARHAHEMHFPYHRSAIGWSWRGEHAKVGRYRSFIQADIDTVATTLSPLADAQCIVTMIKGLQKLGVPKCTVFLNHVEIAKSFLEQEGIPADKYNDALRAIDKLKPDNEAEVVAELVANVGMAGFQEKEAQNLLRKMSYRGPISGFKFDRTPTEKAVEGLYHLLKIEEMAIKMGIPKHMLEFAPNLTRGLNYYTGVLFETFMPGQEKYGSIASGGRYDKLVADFNPKLKLQGVGGSIGVTRLFDVMKAENLVDLSKETIAQCFIGYRTENELPTAIELATAIRERLGVPTELHVMEPKVKKQLELADGKGIPTAILVMNPDEIVIKDLNLQKTTEKPTEQKTFTNIDDVVGFVKNLGDEAVKKDGNESKSNI